MSTCWQFCSLHVQQLECIRLLTLLLNAAGMRASSYEKPSHRSARALAVDAEAARLGVRCQYVIQRRQQGVDDDVNVGQLLAATDTAAIRLVRIEY